MSTLLINESSDLMTDDDNDKNRKQEWPKSDILRHTLQVFKSSDVVDKRLTNYFRLQERRRA